MKIYIKPNLMDKSKYNTISKALETKEIISQLKIQKSNKISSRAKRLVQILN